MPQVVPHVSRTDLAIHHVRARCVLQPMGGRLAQSLGCALVRFACRLQVPNRVVEHLFDSQMFATTSHRPVGATNWQQQRSCRRHRGGQRDRSIGDSELARRHRQQALPVSLVGDRQPLLVLAIAIV
jgi:hypothetical protein